MRPVKLAGRGAISETRIPKLIGELGVEIRIRQSPDWRLAGRHSGEWRSRDRRPAEISQRGRISTEEYDVLLDWAPLRSTPFWEITIGPRLPSFRPPSNPFRCSRFDLYDH